MMVSIYDVTAQVQSFVPADDSFALLMATPGICGDKTHVSNQALAVVAQPASTLVNLDPWTITSITNNYADVATYTVTITISLINYPTVAPVTVSYLLTVFDNCATATIDNLGQALGSINYVVLLALGPTTIDFLPYTDNVAQSYSNPPICGPKVYTLIEGYPFVTLIPPASGLDYTDAWTISVETPNIPEVGMYIATFEGTLTSYPTATPTSLSLTIEIVHPCTLTLFNGQALMPMVFYFGDP
jgi:hypothetical protein